MRRRQSIFTVQQASFGTEKLVCPWMSFSIGCLEVDCLNVVSRNGRPVASSQVAVEASLRPEVSAEQQSFS